MFALGIVVADNSSEISMSLFINGSLMFLAALIWSFVDLFLVWKGIKKDNLKKSFRLLANLFPLKDNFLRVLA